MERVVHVVGYGQTDEDTTNKEYTLREVNLKILYMEDCNDLHDIKKIGSNYERKLRDNFFNFPSLFERNQFCGRSLSDDWGTCRGDSGAPALYHRRINDPFILYGILHGSIGDNCNSQDFPSTFLRVDEPEILTWIEDTMQGVFSMLYMQFILYFLQIWA